MNERETAQHLGIKVFMPLPEALILEQIQMRSVEMQAAVVPFQHEPTVFSVGDQLTLTERDIIYGELATLAQNPGPLVPLFSSVPGSTSYGKHVIEYTLRQIDQLKAKNGEKSLKRQVMMMYHTDLFATCNDEVKHGALLVTQVVSGLLDSGALEHPEYLPLTAGQSE